jgi:hypothetical protein
MYILYLCLRRSTTCCFSQFMYSYDDSFLDLCEGLRAGFSRNFHVADDCWMPVPMSSSLIFLIPITGGEQNKLKKFIIMQSSSSFCCSLSVCLFCLGLKLSPQQTQTFCLDIFLTRKIRICIQNLGALRPSLFWDITKPMLVVAYRLLHSWMCNRLAVPKSLWRTFCKHRGGSQKSRI